MRFHGTLPQETPRMSTSFLVMALVAGLAIAGLIFVLTRGGG